MSIFYVIAIFYEIKIFIGSNFKLLFIQTIFACKVCVETVYSM